MDIGNKLKLLREKYDYSQAYVASKLNVSRPAYSNYENNKSYMDYFIINKLIKLYNIDANYLFDNEEHYKDTGLNLLLEMDKKLKTHEKKELFWKLIKVICEIYSYYFLKR